MTYLYTLLIIVAVVFVAYSFGAQMRLSGHTDAQARFYVAAKGYRFSPLKSMAKRILKYWAAATALALILLGGAAAIYGIAYNAMPDLRLTAAVFAISSAAYALNGLLILMCATIYVRHKTNYTAVM